MEHTAQIIDTVLRFLQVIVVPLLVLGIREFRSLRQAQRRQSERTQKLEANILRHEEKLAELPDKSAMHDLSLAMTTIQGDLKAMNEKIGGLKTVVEKLDRVLDRQEEYLLHCGGNKR